MSKSYFFAPPHQAHVLSDPPEIAASHRRVHLTATKQATQQSRRAGGGGRGGVVSADTRTVDT